MTTIKTWQERIKPEYHSVERFAMAGMQIEIDELRAENAKLRKALEVCATALSQCAKCARQTDKPDAFKAPEFVNEKCPMRELK